MRLWTWRSPLKASTWTSFAFASCIPHVIDLNTKSWIVIELILHFFCTPVTLMQELTLDFRNFGPRPHACNHDHGQINRKLQTFHISMCCAYKAASTCPLSIYIGKSQLSRLCVLSSQVEAPTTLKLVTIKALPIFACSSKQGDCFRCRKWASNSSLSAWKSLCRDLQVDCSHITWKSFSCQTEHTEGGY